MREKSIGVYHFCAYKYFRANPFKQNAQESFGKFVNRSTVLALAKTVLFAI